MEVIGDYAVIGDCRTAALVSRAGSIDWLCWPRFDSASVFARLLDDGAGFWRVAPVGRWASRRQYIDGTNVLETEFHSDTFVLRLYDLMPVCSEEDKRRLLVPDHEILRIVRCERGELELEMVLEARPRFAACRPRIRQDSHGVRIGTDGGVLFLRSTAKLACHSDEIRALIKLKAGERAEFVLTFEDEYPAVLPPLGEWSLKRFDDTCDWWRRWLCPLRYHGPDPQGVERSALVLKLMGFAPSGAIIAAPTTSLPERLGASLNWDYRFCWLRDASLTVRALFGLGFNDEAEGFVSWLLHSTRLTRPELRILYDVYGRQPARERELPQLRGYRDSRPVRVGNGAASQLQLDVYGEVIDATTQYISRGGPLDRDTRQMLLSFGEYVCRHWNEPDEGIWEPRSGKNHNTHSRVLCWVALDRLIRLCEDGRLKLKDGETFHSHREAIRRQVMARSWNQEIGSYVSRLDGNELDASLLLLSWYGFENPDSPRMQSTYRKIRSALGAGNDLVYRYLMPDGQREGAFGICSFWAAEYLALGGGSEKEAQHSFETLLRYANDVGLFAEEIDPQTGEARGNFPQAFTHVGLINAALTLQDRLDGKIPKPRRAAP